MEKRPVMKCKQCSNDGFENQALGKKFFYCRTCKVEIHPQDGLPMTINEIELSKEDEDYLEFYFGQPTDIWGDMGIDDLVLTPPPSTPPPPPDTFLQTHSIRKLCRLKHDYVLNRTQVLECHCGGGCHKAYAK